MDKTSLVEALLLLSKRAQIDDQLGLACRAVLEFVQGETKLAGERGQMLRKLNSVTAIRPVVLDFALVMEAKLAKNDHKKEWGTFPVSAFLHRLRGEVEELEVALTCETPEHVTKECADVANFACIIQDVHRRKHGIPPIR